jgi:excisionase family DNA binding protein
MSALEESFSEIVRKVVREELQAFMGASTDERLLTADDVALRLRVSKQKIYSLKREGKLKAIMINQREMRFAPEAVRQFQLNEGVTTA